MSSAATGPRDGTIHAVRTLVHVAAGLEKFPTVWRCLVYRFAQSVCQAVPIGLLVLVVDRLRADAVTPRVALLYGSVAVAALVAQCVCGRLSHADAWVAGLDFSRELRMRVLDHLRRLPISFHARRPPADSAATFTSDLYAIETFVEGPLPRMATVGLPLALLVELVAIDPGLALAAMLSIALSLPVFVLTHHRLRRLSALRQELQAEANRRVIEYVQGIAVIRAFGRQGAARARVDSALVAFRAINNRLVLQFVPLIGTFGAIVRLGVPIVIMAIAYPQVGGTVDAGAAVVFCVLTLAMYGPIVTFIGATGLMHVAAASLDRVAQILDEPVDPEPAQPARIAGHEVRFDHVSFAYEPGVPVLEEVSFTAPERSFTAIVGPSGAGKTTVLNLLARFWRPDRGSVRIGGADLRELSAEQLFDTVSVVFQDAFLFSGTVLSNIAFGRADATREDVVAAATAARCHDFVNALPHGYDTEVGEGGQTLSGGERQRIGIARAILKDAPVVLLDEATAALDPINEKAIQQALASLTADKTLIVVAHRLSTIQAADQILVLDGGRIVQRGTHDELVAAAGLYARFCAQRERASGWRLQRSETARLAAVDAS